MIRSKLSAVLIAVTALLAFGGFAANSASATATASGERLSITASSPVTASTIPDGCSSGNVCFWRNANWGDGPGQLSDRNPNWGVFAHQACPNHTWSNCISSVYNAGVSCNAVLWAGTNYTGDSRTYNLTLGRGVGLKDLGNQEVSGDAFNDVISSNSWGKPGGGTSSACGGPI